MAKEEEFLKELKSHINNGKSRNDLKTLINQRLKEIVCDHEPRRFDNKYTTCRKCDMILQMKPNANF